MIRLGLPILLLVAIAIAVSAARRRAAAPVDPRLGAVDTVARDTGRVTTTPPPPVASGWSATLERWQGAGLIDEQQAAAIRAFETQATASTPPPAPQVVKPRRVPLVAEALGYLGGLLGIIGLTVFVAGFWRDMEGGTRLAVSVGVTVVLVAIGFAVKAGDDVSLQRLRGFVWLVGSAAAGVLGGVVANDIIDATNERSIATGAALGVFVVGTALWAWRDRPAQALSSLAALLVATATITWDLTNGVGAGFAVMALSIAITALGVRRALPAAWVATIVGGAGLLAGSVLPTSEWDERGTLLGVAAVLALVALAQAPRTGLMTREWSTLLVIAIPALFSLGAPSIVYFGDDAGIATGAVVWLVGLAAIAAGANGLARQPLSLELIGGLVVVGGAAIVGLQSEDLATVVGLLSALAMLGLGTQRGLVLMSVTGSVGLLVNVPWSISHFFPGENRAPLLIAVSGLLIVAIAVVLTRMGGRFRTELRR